MVQLLKCFALQPHVMKGNGSRLVHPDALLALLATAWAAVHVSTCITQHHVLAGHHKNVPAVQTT
jgi:hypothetical protein